MAWGDLLITGLPIRLVKRCRLSSRPISHRPLRWICRLPFATRETSTHGLPTYSIPGPGMKLSRGGRTIVMVGDDTTSVPPYYLIRDDVQLDDQAHLYEQLSLVTPT